MGGRLFVQNFVDNVIQRLEKQNEELQSLRDFKRKITTTLEQGVSWISGVCAFCEKSVSSAEFSYLDDIRQCDCCGKVYCEQCWNKDKDFITQEEEYEPGDVVEIYCCKNCKNVHYITCKYSGEHIDCWDTFGTCDVCDEKLCEFCTIRVNEP
jgi:hypothetical protein